TLTRYEVWVLLIAATAVLVAVARRKGYDRHRIEGTTLAFLLLGALGIVGWLGWNELIFGNPLNWQNGQYAKPSLWVSAAAKAVGSWPLSLETYWYAMVDNLGLVVVAVCIVGVAVLALRRRVTVRTAPALSLLVMFPFFVYALESGQRPLHVPQVGSDLYNVRF